jgi:hypothetical protein
LPISDKRLLKSFIWTTAARTSCFCVLRGIAIPVVTGRTATSFPASVLSYAPEWLGRPQLRLMLLVTVSISYKGLMCVSLLLIWRRKKKVSPRLNCQATGIRTLVSILSLAFILHICWTVYLIRQP